MEEGGDNGSNAGATVKRKGLGGLETVIKEVRFSSSSFSSFFSEGMGDGGAFLREGGGRGGKKRQGGNFEFF